MSPLDAYATLATVLGLILVMHRVQNLYQRLQQFRRGGDQAGVGLRDR